MLPATLRPLQVFPFVYTYGDSADPRIDDVRDIYQRAEKAELVVEGLREGTNLVAEE